MSAEQDALLYEKFVVDVFVGVNFDENAVSSDDLQRSAERFEALRKFWLGLKPYGDPKLEGNLNGFKAHAELISTELLLQVERSLDLLSQFCLEKSRAAHRRQRGSIEAATSYEAAAERAYNQLPKQWKW